MLSWRYATSSWRDGLDRSHLNLATCSILLKILEVIESNIANAPRHKGSQFVYAASAISHCRARKYLAASSKAGGQALSTIWPEHFRFCGKVLRD